MEDNRKSGKSSYIINQRQHPKNYPVLHIQFGAAIIFFIGLLLGGNNVDEPSTFTTICTLFALGLMTFVGILIIVQKEMPRPGLPSIKGAGARITGVIVTLIFGFGTLFFLLLLTTEALK